MFNRYFYAGLLLLVTVNAVVLFGVYHNRSEVTATLTLTERELSLPYFHYSGRDENSAVSLHLNWQTHNGDNNSFVINSIKVNRLGQHHLSKEQAQALGFNLSDQTEKFFTPSKTLYWALEFDGNAYRAFVTSSEAALSEEIQLASVHESDEHQHRLQSRQRELDSARYSASRLFTIDFSVNASELQSRYQAQNNIVIVKALSRLYFDAKHKYYSLSIGELLVPQIQVPQELNQLFSDLKRPDYNLPQLPRYQVTVKWGKRFEPWIESVTRFSEEK